MVAIISRASWGAREDNGFGDAPMPYRGIYLHHSVTIAPDLIPPFDDDYAAVRTLERIGEQRFGGGISYTWAATPAGLIFEGHSVGRRGAHTAKMNSTVRAVVMVGDYSRRRPSASMIDGIAQLVAQEYRAGRSQARGLLGGHRQAPHSVGTTACPGNSGLAVIPEINALALRYINGGQIPQPQPPEPEEDEVAVLPTIKPGEDEGHPETEEFFCDLMNRINPDRKLDMSPAKAAARGQAIEDVQVFFDIPNSTYIDSSGKKRGDRICGPASWRTLLAVRTKGGK